jgi:hypothetical protein
MLGPSVPRHSEFPAEERLPAQKATKPSELWRCGFVEDSTSRVLRDVEGTFPPKLKHYSVSAF